MSFETLVKSTRVRNRGAVVTLYFRNIASFSLLYKLIMITFSNFQVAMPDVVEASKNADIIIFVMPHQFVRGTCQLMKGNIKDTALAVSLIKVKYIMKSQTIAHNSSF